MELMRACIVLFVSSDRLNAALSRNAQTDQLLQKDSRRQRPAPDQHNNRKSITQREAMYFGRVP